VLTLDPHRGARLAVEALHGFRILECFRQQELQRYALTKLQVRRSHDDTHASAPEHELDSVFASQELTLRDLHCSWPYNTIGPRLATFAARHAR